MFDAALGRDLERVGRYAPPANRYAGRENAANVIALLGITDWQGRARARALEARYPASCQLVLSELARNATNTFRIADSSDMRKGP